MGVLKAWQEARDARLVRIGRDGTMTLSGYSAGDAMRIARNWRPRDLAPPARRCRWCLLADGTQYEDPDGGWHCADEKACSRRVDVAEHPEVFQVTVSTEDLRAVLLCIPPGNCQAAVAVANLLEALER